MPSRNDATELVPRWPDIRLDVPGFCPPRRSIPEEAFPQSFRIDVDNYLRWLRGEDPLAEDAPLRPCRETTCKVRRRYIFLAASAAVEGGIRIDSLHALRDLAKPEVVRVALDIYLRRSDSKVTGFIIDLADVMASIGRHWCKLAAPQLDELGQFSKKLGRHRRYGLTEKNLQAIRLLKDPINWSRLCRLPINLMDEALAADKAIYRAAVKAQIAAAIQILIVAPMRVGNLISLSLTENVLQPGGLDGPVQLYIPEHDVKNGVPLEFPMPKQAGDLLLLYKQAFRNRLKGSSSKWLFPGENGDHKEPRTMSEQITEMIERRLGFHITPHQFRHAAAALILEADPGNYELVRRVLGHRNIPTTINFSVGLETSAAARQYAELALRTVRPDDSAGDHP